jgi:5-formyltetrahydrofolate cyclo-ligase
MIDPDKSALRAEFRRKRAKFVQALRPAERAVSFSKAPSPMRRLFKADAVVAGYIPIGSEADPQQLMAEAERAGCRLALPHITSRTAPMRFLKWSLAEPLEPGPMGLQQPQAAAQAVQPDIVLVPLIAFDASLARLGQGAGHYDRALSQLPEALALGIAWSVQQAEALPTDPWDVPLDAIVTEKAWISI